MHRLATMQSVTDGWTDRRTVGLHTIS